MLKISSKNKNSAEKLIKFSKSQIQSKKIKFKKITKRKENSCYILETKLTDNLNDDFTLKDIFEFLVTFYENIDNKIIKNYTTFTKYNS